MKLDQFVDELFQTVTGMVERALQQAASAIEELRAEVKAIPAGAPGRDGKDADEQVIARVVAEAVAALPKPRDGKDVDPEAVKRLVTEAVGALPAPRDGRDADPEVIRAMVQEAFAAMPKPRDGVDGKVDEQAIQAMVARAVEALPKARDGKDADPEVIAQLLAAEVTKTLEALRADEAQRVKPEAVAELRESLAGCALNSGIEDMVDVVARGLAGFADFHATPEAVLRELTESVTSLTRTLREPCVPVFDEEGRITAAQRGA